MIGLEQWRASIEGCNYRALYRRYGSRRIVRKWPKLLLIVDDYRATVCYALYWVFVVLLAFMSAEGFSAALSLVFDDTCGYQRSLFALVQSPTTTVLQFSQDSLQRFWVSAIPTVAPILRTCQVFLQRLCKLAASPSASSMMRLLVALHWLLIVAGDVELNPGPIPSDIAELLPTVDDSELTEVDLFDVLEEVWSLAVRWRSMCLALRLLDADTIASSYHDNPGECLRATIQKWLKMVDNTQWHGPPSWRKLVGAVANSMGGNDPALAETIAKNHQGTAKTEKSSVPSTDRFSDTSSVIKSHAEYLRGMYQTKIPTFLTLQWPPPPTRKVLRLAMIQGQNIDYDSREEIIRLTLHGRVNDVVNKKTPVKLEDIFRIDMVAHKVILIEGAPGSGKSTLAWYICQQWQASKLFQEFGTVVFVQLQDPAIHSAKVLEDLFPAESKSQAVAVVAELQAKQGRGMLWVMDGWDELPVHLRTNSIFHKLILFPSALNLHFSAIVVTSRPVTFGNLYCSSRVKIVGFAPTEVKEYFTEALRRDLQLVEKLQNYLKEQPIIEACCYVPLNAAIVTHLFLAQSQSLPTTLHGVFTSLVICCLIRHMTKGGEECYISSLDSIPSCLKEPFHKICALAYHGVMENKATFSAKDFKQLRLPQELETLGLIQGVENIASFEKSVSYNFLHISVQELLASFYISKLPANEEIEVFKRLFGQPRFAAVFQFYAAFTKLKTPVIREVVANIVKKKEKPQILYLIHGLYEARDVSLCQFIISQLSGQFDVSRNSLSPVDCLSIGYFLCCVCRTTEGEFVVDLSFCSLDYNRVRFLMKEFLKSSNAMVTTGAEVPSSTQLHLHLAGNTVGDDGVTLLCAALNVNHSLKALDLRGNEIGLSGATVIAKLIRQNKTLKELDLRSNKIPDEGVKVLHEALRVNQSLTQLRVTDDEDSPDYEDRPDYADPSPSKTEETTTKTDVLPFEEVKEKPYTQVYLQLQAEKEMLQEESRESHEIIRTSDVKTTEYLRGVEVIAGTRFVTEGRHPQTFEWRNHGLKISIPELSDGVELAIDIKAGLAGQFELPAGAQLVSPVYWLCCRQKFEHPVTLEIQHCAVIRNHTECSSLQFVAAKCSQEVLPYVFKPLRHGVFSMDSSFGTIEVKQFSLFGIIEWLWSSPPRKYFTQLYYIVKGDNTWQLHFIMAWNLPLCIEAIQSTYSRLSIEPGPDMLVQFKKEAIFLDIPKGGITENGWHITPLFPPVITKQQVDEFKPGQRIPSCQFKVKWVGEGSPKAWETEVTLHGAEDHHAQQHAPFYFTISLPPDQYNMKRPVAENVQDTGTAVPLSFSEPHLKHLVLIRVNNWYNLGLQLDLKVECLDEIKSNNHGNIEDCRREMFHNWLHTQINPSYKQLVTALGAIGENKEASQLCEKYGILMPS